MKTIRAPSFPLKSSKHLFRLWSCARRILASDLNIFSPKYIRWSFCAWEDHQETLEKDLFGISPTHGNWVIQAREPCGCLGMINIPTFSATHWVLHLTHSIAGVPNTESNRIGSLLGSTEFLLCLLQNRSGSEIRTHGFRGNPEPYHLAIPQQEFFPRWHTRLVTVRKTPKETAACDISGWASLGAQYHKQGILTGVLFKVDDPKHPKMAFLGPICWVAARLWHSGKASHLLVPGLMVLMGPMRF